MRKPLRRERSFLVTAVAGASRFGLLLLLAAAMPSAHAQDAAAPDLPQAGQTGAMPDLHNMLMRKFDGMNHANQGVFREDITASLAPYFPVGQPLAETRRIIAAQHLGSLQPFMGTNDPGMGKMFVTRFDLVSHMFGHVDAVLDFDFEGTGEAARLKHMQAFLHASNM